MKTLSAGLVFVGSLLFLPLYAMHQHTHVQHHHTTHHVHHHQPHTHTPMHHQMPTTHSQPTISSASQSLAVQQIIQAGWDYKMKLRQEHEKQERKMMEEKSQTRGFEYAFLPFAIPASPAPQAAASSSQSNAAASADKKTPAQIVSQQLEEGEAAYQAKDYEKALNLFKIASSFQNKNPEARNQAQLRMGEIFEQGLGVEQSENNAWECYNCVAAQNWNQTAKTAAQEKLKAMIPRIEARAKQTENPAAQVHAQLQLAEMYFLGHGVAADSNQARHYFELVAAQKTDPRQAAQAQVRLAEVYNTLGLNDQEGNALQSAATQNDNPKAKAAAQARLAEICLKQGKVDDMQRYCNEVLNQNLHFQARATAQVCLGQFFFNNKNFAKAREFFVPAAKQSANPQARILACSFLGRILHFGLGCQKNPLEALPYHEIVANQSYYPVERARALVWAGETLHTNNPAKESGVSNWFGEQSEKAISYYELASEQDDDVEFKYWAKFYLGPAINTRYCRAGMSVPTQALLSEPWLKRAKETTKKVKDLEKECLDQDVNKRVKALTQVKRGRHYLSKKKYSKARDYFKAAAEQDDDKNAKTQAEQGLKEAEEAGCSVQ